MCIIAKVVLHSFLLVYIRYDCQKKHIPLLISQVKLQQNKVNFNQMLSCSFSSAAHSVTKYVIVLFNPKLLLKNFER